MSQNISQTQLELNHELLGVIYGRLESQTEPHVIKHQTLPIGRWIKGHVVFSLLCEVETQIKDDIQQAKVCKHARRNS